MKIQILKQARDSIEGEAWCKENGEPFRLPADVWVMARLEGDAQAELDVSDVRLDVVDLASHLFQYWRFYAARLAEKEHSLSSFKLKTLVDNIIPAADKAKGLGDADRRSSTRRPRIRT